MESDKNKSVNWSELVQKLSVSQLQDLTNDVVALEKALNKIPESFDESFQNKINTIIDVSAQLEKFSLSWERELTEKLKLDLKTDLKGFEKAIEILINQKTKKENNFKLYSFIGGALLVNNILLLTGFYLLFTL